MPGGVGKLQMLSINDQVDEAMIILARGTTQDSNERLSGLLSVNHKKSNIKKERFLMLLCLAFISRHMHKVS